jgi:cytochrome oxidase Cu insertion factor (SCO1/SenC/PrrC family)
MFTGYRVFVSAMLLCAGIGGGVRLSSSQQNAAPDVTVLGPRVGEKVPDFALSDQHGKRHTLASLMGEKGLVLVFHRSADW